MVYEVTRYMHYIMNTKDIILLKNLRNQHNMLIKTKQRKYVMNLPIKQQYK